MKIRAKDKGFKFPYLYDETQEVAKAFGAAHTPHVFVLTKEHEALIVKYVGAIDDNSDEPEKVKNRYVYDAITALLQGAKVSVPSTNVLQPV